MKKYTYQQLLNIIEKNGRYLQCVQLAEIMFSIEHETGKAQNWCDTAPDWVSWLFVKQYQNGTPSHKGKKRR